MTFLKNNIFCKDVFQKFFFLQGPKPKLVIFAGTKSIFSLIFITISDVNSISNHMKKNLDVWN